MRLPEITPEELTGGGREVYEALRSGPRSSATADLSVKSIVGPYGVWVRAPAIGGPTQATGCRSPGSQADSPRRSRKRRSARLGRTTSRSLNSPHMSAWLAQRASISATSMRFETAGQQSSPGKKPSRTG